MFSPHNLVIAGICIVYFGGMAGIFWHLASQVSGIGESQDDLRQDAEDEPGDLLAALEFRRGRSS